MIYQQATKYCGKEEKSFRQSFQNISNLGVRLHIHSVKDGCSINCFPQFRKSDMSKYGYLEVFHRVPWISYNESRLYFFLSTSHFDASYQVSGQLAFRFRRRNEKYIFNMPAMAAILVFRLERFLFFLSTIFAPMLLLSFDSIGLSVQEKKRKNRFSRWPPCWPAWISIGTIFASLNLQVNPTPLPPRPQPPNLSTQVRVIWPFRSGEEAKNRFSR